MDSLLEKLKLTDHLTTELIIERKEFIDKLKRNVDEGNISVFFSPFEIFSSSKNEYIGTVTYDSFKLRRRKRIFDMKQGYAIVEGTFKQNENTLIINSTIKGFRGIFIFYLVALLFAYMAGFFAFIFSDVSQPIWLPLFFLLHAAFMFGIPYFIMRKSVSRMKYDLERDLYFMTK
jgi:hypothetical protein